MIYRFHNGWVALPDGAVGNVKLFAKHSCIDVRADCAERRAFEFGGVV